MNAMQFIPATPEAIRALHVAPDLLFGLTRSDLVSIFAIAISVATTVMVTRSQMKATRQRDREVAQAAALAEERDAQQRNISATLDFHREYNSPEMAAVRDGAHRFILLNPEIDWENEPELMAFNCDGATAVSLFELMRFFQRVSVVWKLGRLDEELLAELLGHEVAWWQGMVFDLMGRRPSSRTLPAVRTLIADLRTPQRAPAWDEVVEQARTYRTATPPPKPRRATRQQKV
ncbi:MAG: hypothetical protein ACK4UQ_08885 [Brevundimonas sp.]